MAAKDKAAQAKHQAKALRKNPYIRQIVEDEELRHSVWQAYDSVRGAYSRMSNGKSSPGKAIFDDKKLQKDLKRAAQSIQQAGVAMHDAPKKQRKSGLRRLFVLAVVGGILAVVFSEDLRNKVLDLMFGAEEKFDYSSTTNGAANHTTESS